MTLALRARPHVNRLPIHALGLLCGLFILVGYCVAQPNASAVPATSAVAQAEEINMWMTVGERRFAITLADTEAAHIFAAMLPLSLDMVDLHRREKYADMHRALPTQASRPGTIRSGDLMLYGTRTLVVFYATFDSSYAYTRLGRVDDPTGLAEVLGSGDVHVAFIRD